MRDLLREMVTVHSASLYAQAVLRKSSMLCNSNFKRDSRLRDSRNMSKGPTRQY